MGGRDDLTGKFNTPLTPDEEKRFQAWARASGRTGDVYDYDLRGAWKANAKEAENGHLTDKFKKPNHPTFSNESVYSGKPSGKVGGRWVEGKGGKWSFMPSADNLTNLPPDQLQQYFKRSEPDASLVMPLTPQQYRMVRKK